MCFAASPWLIVFFFCIHRAWCQALHTSLRHTTGMSQGSLADRQGPIMHPSNLCCVRLWSTYPQLLTVTRFLARTQARRQAGWLAGRQAGKEGTPTPAPGPPTSPTRCCSAASRPWSSPRSLRNSSRQLLGSHPHNRSASARHTARPGLQPHSSARPCRKAWHTAHSRSSASPGAKPRGQASRWLRWTPAQGHGMEAEGCGTYVSALRLSACCKHDSGDPYATSKMQASAQLASQTT